MDGHNEWTNNKIVHRIIEVLNLPDSRSKYAADWLDHDRRYTIYPKKIETELRIYV